MGKGIIDIHTHILPELDDGAASWTECRQMLTKAYEQGIRAIVATPHFSFGQDTRQIRHVAQVVQEEAREIASDYQILLGQEILYFDSVTDYLKTGQALTMAATRYVLVEFLPTSSFKLIYQAIRRLIMFGYHPILAHVERYMVLRKAEHLQDILKTGCYLQMNYHSLEGSIWDPNVRWCRKQVQEGHIHLLGTDAHHASHRSPEIEASKKWLYAHVEEQQIQQLVHDNAQEILQSN